MKIRIKKANDTRLIARLSQYNDDIMEALNKTLDDPKFENFDFVQSLDNKNKFSIFNYEKGEAEDFSYLDQDAKDFVDTLDKELNKKDLFIMGEDRREPNYFVIRTKEEKEEFANKEQRLEQERQERLAARTEREQAFEQRVQDMVSFINERVGDFIIWRDPPYQENRNDGELRPSFGYNRDNPDLDQEAVRAVINEYINQQD
jgi:hypothetical protein